DNIIEKNIFGAVENFKKQENGAKIIVKQVPDPERFGVPILEGDTVIAIEEKPDVPKSNYAVVGIYMFDNSVFDIIRTLQPSRRGELEITDVNNVYIKRGNMTYEFLDGWWTDAGTFDSLRTATNLVAETGANKI
ncbi:MAG: dTDP-glucose pyrophosphorylase, partial [Deltaproteobacteria bacterium]|nr:dTDP-glucose pyrophosphorylase [Deltaproteobacteria bacterium]